MKIFHPCTCFVVPPVLLKELTKNGAVDDRATAIDTLAASARLKGRRDIMAHLTMGGIAPGAQTVPDALRRRIFDANSTDQLPGNLVRSEDTPQSTPDVRVTEAFDGAGIVYDFLKSCFGRNSIDDRGLRMDSTVNFGRNYLNAFWEGQQMVYGNGDGRFFNRFTIDPVIIIHETTHGVIQHECNLDYYDQSGSVNEHLADIMGVTGHHWYTMCKLQNGWSFKNANWLIGAGLFTAAIKGRGLRDLSAPGTAYNDPLIGHDLQPAHMKDFVVTTEDERGVHINSGIPNHAYFLACEQLQDIPTWQAPGAIWYQSLLRLRRYSDLSALALTTYKVASELCGSRSREQLAIKKAWEAVGLPLPA